MSPKILVEGYLVFWFHSYDALHENRASVHVGKSSQDDRNDAKIWLEPDIEVAHRGHILSHRELNRALKIIEENRDFWRHGMITNVEQVETPLHVKHYKVQYPISAYTFPQEARIHRVWFDEECMHVELTDGREVSIPLWWIPTVYNAVPEEREKYEINQSRTMIIWDPAKCGINDEVCIADYLAPRFHSGGT